MSTLNTYNLKSPDSANTNLALDASGNVAIQAGSASAPSIYVTGDANTGIYSPGADQVAISTNGTGRLFIDSSGRLGLGTSSPSNILHVSGTAGTPAVFERTSTTGTFIALKDSASQTFIGNTNGVFSIQTPGSSYSDKLVVTSAGLVGIGTTSPAGKCVVRVSNNTGAPTAWNSNFLVVSNGDAGTSSGLGFSIDTDSSSTSISSLTPGTGWLTQNYRANAHVFWYGDAGVTQAARIDSSGRLLVGTSSSTGSARAVFQGSSFSSGQPGIILIQRDTSSSGLTAGAAMGYIIFGDNVGSNYAVIGCEADGATGTNDYPSRLVFSTTADGASSPTERMRITQAGDAFIGDTSAQGVTSARVVTGERIVNVNSDAIADQSASLMARQANSANEGTANSCILAYYRDALAISPGAFFKGYRGSAATNGTIRIKINSDGNITNSNNSYGSLSDIKLKENIVDASSQWNDIKNLRVRNYNFKEETGQQTHRQIGLIAQETELVSPGLVTDIFEANNEVTKTINYSVLYMKAVKALQEAMERIEQLETEMAAVKAQLS